MQTHPDPAPVADLKKALRSPMAAALKKMNPEDRAARSERLVRDLQAQERFAGSRQIFCYVSMPEEVDTHGLIRACLAQGKRVAVPRVVPGTGQIEARTLDRWDESWVPGPFGIHEPDPAVSRLVTPAQIDCVVVPGLAFDADRYRLGRGKGYYDRFLAALGPAAFRVALAFEFQRVAHVPREPHDERVDLVLYA